MSPVFSIIIPLFNAEKWISQCLESIQKQTFDDFEVIIVDDGSQDSSSDVTRQFIADDSRFRLMLQMNQGQSVARNAGLAVAKGEYVLFVDSDDVISIHLLKIVHSFIRESEPDAVAYYLKKVRRRDVETEVKPEVRCFRKMEFPEDSSELVRKGSPLKGSVCTKAYRREVIENNKIRFDPELRKGQDAVFNLEFFKYATNVVCIDPILYFYLYNPQSIVNRYTENKIEIYLRHFRKENAILADLGLYESHKIVRNSRLLEMASDCFINANHADSPLTFREARTEIIAICSIDEVSKAISDGALSGFRQLGLRARLVFILVYLRFFTLVELLYAIRSR